MRNFIILLALLFSGCSFFKSPFEKATSNMEKKEEITKEKVIEWLKNNSKFPQSYIGIKFTKYSYGAIMKKNEILPDTEFYIIYHEFKLRCKTDSLLKYNVGFRFDINHKLIDLENEVVEDDEESFSVVSKMKEWQDLFGK